MRISEKMKGVIMRNLRDTVFYVKTNVLQDFHKNLLQLLAKFISELSQSSRFKAPYERSNEQVLS